MWKPTPTSQNQNPVTPGQSGSGKAPVAVPVHSPDQTFIGKSLMIKGQVSGSEALHVEGRIEGTISMLDKRVVIGRSATIIADIAAGEVTVSGELRGKITAQDRVELREHAAVLGDVLTKRISIEAGAVFKGNIDMCRKDDKRDGVRESDPGVQPHADHTAVSALVASGAGAD